MAFNIVLVEPEIPQNTGNIVRTCAATKSILHLVRPLGFEVTDKHLKRAGLDYWYLTEIYYYDSIEEVFEKFSQSNFYFLSTKAKHIYTEPKFKDGDFLVYGKETRGLKESLLKKYYDHTLRIPMLNESRSLNLANSVAIVLYEALRQLDFPLLKADGELTGRID